jgi:2-dehydropantoate 2-reductase
MRVVVVGCGAIGGTLAAHLTRAGVDVTPVCGNHEVAEALASEGFRVVEHDGARWSVPAARPPLVSLAQRPPGPPFDLCLLATKATTLRDALVDALPHLARETPVVCLQNGLPEEIAAGVVGPARVLGGVVAFGATMATPGEYLRTSRGGLQIGRPAGSTAAAARVATLLEKAGPVSMVEDLAAVRWSKLAINCATSTLGAIGGERLGALLRRRHIRRLVLELWTEVVQVAHAAGVRMAQVGGTLDIERMSLTETERQSALGSPALAFKHSILLAVGMKFRRLRSSMLVALERGRTPEIDFLNGEIVRRGQGLGVPTPVNARLCDAVAALAAGDGQPSMDKLRRIYEETVVADARAPLAAA